MKAAGLGQEVGGVTLASARFGAVEGCLLTASAVGSPAVAGKGSGHSEPEWGLSRGRTAGGAQIAWAFLPGDLGRDVASP